MSREAINDLVVIHKQQGCDQTFLDAYKAIKKLLLPKMRYDINFNRFNEHDITAIYDDAIWNTIKEYEERTGCFMSLLYTRLKSRKIDHIRYLNSKKNGDGYKITPFGDATVELGEDFNRDKVPTPEEVAIKKRDQCHLISFLAADEDDFTMKVLKLLPSSKSPNSLATEIGVHHSKVTRVIDRIRQKFDTTRLGDLNDYLSA